jgi:RiboL-PSP-HEPN
MTARTIEEVQDTIDQAFGWRRIELHALVSAMNAAERKAAGSPLSRALARSCVALLYAHWEGFIKEACQCYVDFLARRRLKYVELSDGLLRTALRGLARRLAAGDEAGASALLAAVREPKTARWQMHKASMVDTKSNLRYGVLCEILTTIGMSTDRFDVKRNFIDKALCDVRNGIAHGRDLFPDPQDIKTIHSEVIEMMEVVKDMIMAAVRGGEYRASEARQTLG